MKRVTLFIFMLITLYSALIYGFEKPNKGDIRIFNAAFTLSHLKPTLLYCDEDICTERDLVEITHGSQTLFPGAYFTYKLGTQDVDLTGKKIYLKFYNTVRYFWYPAVQIINQYNPKEDPFYQYTCWARESKQAPNCTEGFGDEPGGD